MLPVIWLDEALQDLAVITTYIAQRSTTAANKINDNIFQCADMLGEHPLLFRPGRVAGTREMVVHPNYILVFRVTVSSVEILNVLHSRQAYP